MRSSGARLYDPLSTRNVFPPGKGSQEISKAGTSPKPALDLEGKNARDEEECQFLESMHERFERLQNLLRTSLRKTEMKVGEIRSNLQARYDELRDLEATANTYFRTRPTTKANAEVIEEALIIVYDAVDAYACSADSANRQPADWRLEEAKSKSSDGRIDPVVLTQKLRALFLHSSKETATEGPELAWLSECLCRELVEWDNVAKAQLLSLRKYGACNAEIDLAADRSRRIERARQCFPNDEKSIKILSLLVFVPSDKVYAKLGDNLQGIANSKLDLDRKRQILYDRDSDSDSDSSAAVVSVLPRPRENFRYLSKDSALVILANRIEDLKPSSNSHVLSRADADGDAADENKPAVSNIPPSVAGPA